MKRVFTCTTEVMHLKVSHNALLCHQNMALHDIRRSRFSHYYNRDDYMETEQRKNHLFAAGDDRDILISEIYYMEIRINTCMYNQYFFKDF